MPASPPLKAIFASGNLRARITVSTIRSPASFSVGALRARPNQPVLGAAKHDEARRRRRLIEIGPREAVLQRQDQSVAERREAGDQQQGRADTDEAPSPARPARPDQDRAIGDQQRDQRGRLEQEPQHLGEIEEHALARPLHQPQRGEAEEGEEADAVRHRGDEHARGDGRVEVERMQPKRDEDARQRRDQEIDRPWRRR